MDGGCGWIDADGGDGGMIGDETGGRVYTVGCDEGLLCGGERVRGVGWCDGWGGHVAWLGDLMGWLVG